MSDVASVVNESVQGPELLDACCHWQVGVGVPEAATTADGENDAMCVILSMT